MDLYINTTKKRGGVIELKLKKGNKLIIGKNITAKHIQAEILLSGIEKFLKEYGIKLNEIKSIHAKNSGGSFTSLRIGIATANALGYALGIELSASDKNSISEFDNYKILIPKYDKEPNIGKKQPQIGKHSPVG